MTQDCPGGLKCHMNYSYFCKRKFYLCTDIILDDLCDLLIYFILTVLVNSQTVEKKRQCTGCGVIPSKEEQEGLGLDLLRCHPLIKSIICFIFHAKLKFQHGNGI